MHAVHADHAERAALRTTREPSLAGGAGNRQGRDSTGRVHGLARSADRGQDMAMADKPRLRSIDRLALVISLTLAAGGGVAAAPLAAAPVAPAPVAPAPAAVTPAATAPAPAASLPRWTGGIDLYRSGVFTTQKTWLWCTAADVQIIRNIVRSSGRPLEVVPAALLRLHACPQPLRIPVSDGVDPAGWAGRAASVSSTAVTASPPARASTAALRSAVTNLRRTNLPVAITVSHGNHAWVLTGFTATADPAVTARFTRHQRPRRRAAVGSPEPDASGTTCGPTRGSRRASSRASSHRGTTPGRGWPGRVGGSRCSRSRRRPPRRCRRRLPARRSRDRPQHRPRPGRRPPAARSRPARHPRPPRRHLGRWMLSSPPPGTSQASLARPMPPASRRQR